MPTDDSVRAAAEAFGEMTDEEAAAWIAAGDYTSVAGIDLPRAATHRIEQLVSGEEVEGFSLDFGPLVTGVSGPSEADKVTQRSNLFKSCCTGEHLKEVILHVR